MLMFQKFLQPRLLITNGVNLIKAQQKSTKKPTGEEGFDEEEVEKFKLIFDKYDCEEKGSLDRWQFNKFVRATMGRKMNAVDLHRIFSRVDRNHDDVIQFEELLSHLERRLSKPGDKDIRRAFNIFDKNSDGRLTLTEVRLALLFLGEDYGNPRVRKVFIRLDDDNDGELNFKDFNKLLKDEERSR